MNNQIKPNLKDPRVIFLSFFGVGFSRFAPGTMGTIATVPVLIGLGKFNLPLIVLILGVLCLTIVACIVAEQAQNKYQVHDPGWIVVDETVGIATAWLFLQSSEFGHLLAIFLLFRLFDIKKFWPASYFDNQGNGVGTILDDIVAGLYAGLIYILGLKMLEYFM